MEKDNTIKELKSTVEVRLISYEDSRVENSEDGTADQDQRQQNSKFSFKTAASWNCLIYPILNFISVKIDQHFNCFPLSKWYLSRSLLS